MESIKGVIRTMPVTGIILIIAVFAITGIPPFNIFVSEFIVLADAFSSKSTFVLIFTSLLIVFLVLIFIGYTNNIFKMIFGEPTDNIVQGEINRFTIAAMCFLLVFVLIISFYVPPIMREILRQISDIMRNA